MVAAPPAAPVEVPQGANALLTPYQMGPFELAHRLVLAPLTRCRAIGQHPPALHLSWQLLDNLWRIAAVLDAALHCGFCKLHHALFCLVPLMMLLVMDQPHLHQPWRLGATQSNQTF